MSIPAPIFWGVIAAWMPVPPAIMGGILISVMIYALLSHFLELRAWATEESAFSES